MVNLQELYNRLLTLGLTVACDKLAEGETATDPYIIYKTNYENISADGIVYSTILSVDLFLVSKNYNKTAETKIEELLNDLFYEKERAYIQETNNYQTLYEIGGINNA